MSSQGQVTADCIISFEDPCAGQAIEHAAPCHLADLLFADKAVDIFLLRQVYAPRNGIDLVAKLLRHLRRINDSKKIGIDGTCFENGLLLSTCVGWHEKSVTRADRQSRRHCCLVIPVPLHGLHFSPLRMPVPLQCGHLVLKRSGDGILSRLPTVLPPLSRGLEINTAGRASQRGGTSMRTGPAVVIQGSVSGSEYFASVAASVNRNMPWPLPSVMALTTSSID